MFLVLATGVMLAAGAPANATEAAEKPQDKKICRKQIETGSLIKGKKICMTAKQWQALADANRGEVERMASSGSQSGQ